MSKQTITIPAGTLRVYLKRAGLFINRTKIGLHPSLSAIMIKGDKCHVYNGEMGTIFNLPFTVDVPVSFFPFDLDAVVSRAKDESDVKLTFDHVENKVIAQVEKIKIKTGMLPVENFTMPTQPEHTDEFEIPNLVEKLRQALPFTSPDASLPALQAIKVGTGGVYSTDKRRIWYQSHTGRHELLVPRMLSECIVRLGIDPTSIAISDDPASIYMFYQHMTIFSARVADEKTAFPKTMPQVVENVIQADNIAEVEYDRESVVYELETLAQLPQYEEGIELSCHGGLLTIKNQIEQDTETAAYSTIPVSCTQDFSGVFVNSKIFLEAASRFHSFFVKADGARLVFQNEHSMHAISRRVIK